MQTICDEQEVLKKISIKIKEQLKRVGITYKEIEHGCNLCNTTVAQTINGKRNVTIKNLVKILNFIGLRFEDIFN